MNRPGVGHQSLRGLPGAGGFPNQQPIPQNRSVSNRLPQAGKMASNGASWAFGGGVPMGSAGLANSRPNNPPMASFAQAMGGSSQPPLDLSEFPSLSNNQPQPSQSTWTASGARGLNPNPLRSQHSLQLGGQQQGQEQRENPYSASSQLSTSQSSFRFGNQGTASQSSGQPSSADDFPPLNASDNIGQERSSRAAQNVGLISQTNGMGFGSSSAAQPNRNNGLLNALSSSRVNSGSRVATPNVMGLSNSHSPVDGTRQGLGGAADNDGSAFSSAFNSSNPLSTREQSASQSGVASGSAARSEVLSQPSDMPRSQTADSGIGSSQGNVEEPERPYVDPLEGMSEVDKFGIKGLMHMMNNYPDYRSMVMGQDITQLGFDLSSTEPFTTQIYSLFDNEPPRPDLPGYELPECYNVQNVAPLEQKMGNLNDESLLFMFYSSPGDVQQIMAASELHTRNWRYHKKLQVWLTKDDMMVPQNLGNGTERGYYIFFDVKLWQRERREFTLVYEDLENLPPTGPAARMP